MFNLCRHLLNGFRPTVCVIRYTLREHPSDQYDKAKIVAQTLLCSRCGKILTTTDDKFECSCGVGADVPPNVRGKGIEQCTLCMCPLVGRLLSCPSCNIDYHVGCLSDLHNRTVNPDPDSDSEHEYICTQCRAPFPDMFHCTHLHNGVFINDYDGIVCSTPHTTDNDDDNIIYFENDATADITVEILDPNDADSILKITRYSPIQELACLSFEFRGMWNGEPILRLYYGTSTTDYS